MIGALKSIEPIGFLSFAAASAGTNRADVNRRIIQNCPYGRGVAASGAPRPVWFRLRRLGEVGIPGQEISGVNAWVAVTVTSTRLGTLPAPTQVVPRVIAVPSSHSQLTEGSLGNVSAGLKFPCSAWRS